jgi:zinc protease
MRATLASVVFAALIACGSSNKPATTKVVSMPAEVIEGKPAVMPVSTPRDLMNEPSPLDPQIKVGKLSNGLTYYVMKHKKPEQRASLWLAVNAGSVQEDDDQRGLAHFVEHMAFNGTKRFPKQAIVDYIEKVGMRFGADVNAYTSFDQTVYMLTVPTDDQKVMFTGFDILRDWAGDVSFDPVEVDKERGVVTEEWRLGRGAWSRINDKQWPVMFQGSKYAERLPIGDPKILANAPRDTLVRYYKDWYRPDQMALIAVGDFDAAQIEAEIKARFGDLKNPATPRPRTVVPVPHEHPLAVSIATDPEMPMTNVSVYDKMDRRPESTKADYRRFIVENIYHSMLGDRFQELGLDPGAPFMFAGSGTTSFARSADLFMRFAQPKEGRVEETLALLFREIERVERYGFLPSELERVRKETLSHAENSAAEWAKTPGDQIADEMTRHFFEGEQMPGRILELAYNKEFLPTITLDELNKLAKSWGDGTKGRVITVSAPAKAKVPTEEQIRKLLATAETAKVEPWQDGPGDKPLMAAKPTPGKVTATATDANAGTTIWTLANGVRVIVKPTTFQNDEVSFEGWQLGGSSLVPDKDYVHARYADDIVGASGVGEFDPAALRKVLAGKVANVSVSFGELTQDVSGSARPADLETALQLAHLRITAPRKDPRAFQTWKQEQLEWVNNRKLMPEVSFFDEMSSVQTNNHLRRRPATPAIINQVDHDKVMKIYTERFADAGSFTFIFVGNIDLATLQPLVETYLGSLPSKGRKEKWKDVGVRYPTKTVVKKIKAGSEPKSFVSLTMNAPDKWTRDAERDATILSMILRIRLREVLREDMGGVYGVSVGAWIGREPTQRRGFRVFFGCNPDNVEKLKTAVFDEVAKIQKEGIGPQYLEKVTEQLRREHETDLKENRWWLSQLQEAYYFGEDFKVVSDVDAIAKRVTSDNVKAAANRFFNAKNYVLGVMQPVAAKAGTPAAKAAAAPTAKTPAPAPAPAKQ